MDRSIRDDEWVKVRSADELRPGMTVRLRGAIQHNGVYVITGIASPPPHEGHCDVHVSCPMVYRYAPPRIGGFPFVCWSLAVSRGWLYRLSDRTVSTAETTREREAVR